MAAWLLHGLCCGEEAGARNLVFFRVKWLQATMKGTSSVRRVRLRSFLSRIVPPMCFATSGCSCVRSSMRFLKLWLQIALEWLHECCMGYVVGRKPEHETLCFSVKSGCRRRWKVPRLSYLYLAVFLYFFLFWAVNEKSNKKEEVQTRITNIFHVFLPWTLPQHNKRSFTINNLEVEC